MSEFYDNFLRELPRPGGLLGWLKGGKAPAAQVHVVAFGKHPGWDDHLDETGTWTASLALARRILYVEGIAGQLDAGSWEGLPEEKCSSEFEHVFLWRRGERSIAGRLWSSTDGKGRARYPMVVGAETGGLSLDWVIEELLPRLETLEAACRGTDSAGEVRACLAETQEALTAGAAAFQASADGAGRPPHVLPEEWRAPETEEAALRVLYCVRSQLAGYAPGWNGGGRPRGLRLSRGPGVGIAEALHSQAGVFDALLDPCVPVLFLLPVAGDFLDVVVGEPDSESFFGLRATLAALPAVDQVPYSFDAAWRQQARAFLGGLRTGKNRSAAGPVGEFWRASIG